MQDPRAGARIHIKRIIEELYILESLTEYLIFRESTGNALFKNNPITIARDDFKAKL